MANQEHVDKVLAGETNCSGFDLSGASFTGLDLSHRNFSKADLSGADLRGVNLSYADLSHANLRGANLGALKK